MNVLKLESEEAVGVTQLVIITDESDGDDDEIRQHSLPWRSIGMVIINCGIYM